MLNVALGQMEVIPGRPDLNTATMLAMISHARQQNAELIVFPEMAIPGYLLGDTWEQEAFLRDCEAFGRQIIAAAENICIVFGNVAIDWEKHGDDGRIRKYNACFVAVNGTLCRPEEFPYPFYIKTLQPNYREFDDSRHFYSLRKLALDLQQPVTNFLKPFKVTLAGKQYNLGCIICEDGWHDDYNLNPLSALQANGPLDILLNISSSPFTLGKNNKRNRVFSRQASELGIPLVYVNTVGLQNNGKTIYTFDGFSTVYDHHGEIIAYCPPFSTTLQIISLPLTPLERQRTPLLPLTQPEDSGIETIYTVLHYGISKFLHIIGMSKIVIGISGGIDSAVAAALYTKILGPDNVLLVNMPSRFNSDTTKSLAGKLAENLQCLYTVMPIEDAVAHTAAQLRETPICKLSLSAQQHKNTNTAKENHPKNVLTVSPFVLENIQARDRSSRILAGVAAAFGGGFTCNANKSELTVGYSTLYGDQAGFLAALADLWKHQVYALAEYLNKVVYEREVIPQATIELVPSAELSLEQSVDEGKGDPLIYPYHDYLFRAFMERWNRATPEDILNWYLQDELEQQIGCQTGLVNHIFPTAADFINDLERWWRLYTGMGVAKRIQAPPILAITRRVYGFDHREAQNSVYYTAEYYRLKAIAISKDSPL